MDIRAFAVAVLALTIWASGAVAWGACRLGQLAELPVTMTERQPLVPVKLDGKDALLVADSGAFFSTLSTSGAAKLGLRTEPAPYGMFLTGIGGVADAQLAEVKQFTFAGVPLHHADFLVTPMRLAPGAVGLLGQNLLGFADVEFDLANGVIRLFKPTGCGGDVNLAYWAKAYSVLQIGRTEARSPQFIANADVNGIRIRVMFDTGAFTSILKLRVAGRAGVHVQDPKVEAGGEATGIGRRSVQSWIGPFDNLSIGNEDVQHTRLRFGDFDLEGADMLLGADFFLSHRIYFSNALHRVYFTYNGGPVFDLTHRAATPDLTSNEPPATASVKPMDAAGFSRRGAAFEARNDLAHAIADFTRAIELAPSDPNPLVSRGKARLANKQPVLAMADLDAALKLKPDDVDALLGRAVLKHRAKDTVGARADLDVAAKSGASDPDLVLQIAGLYESMDQFDAAVSAYDGWIANHTKDEHLAEVLNARCWARALWGQELAKGLADCDLALKLRPRTARFLDSRGLVRLRLGDLDQAINDYDAALRLMPKLAWSLYGRGLAERKKGLGAQGAADIASAIALSPEMSERVRHYGVAP